MCCFADPVIGFRVHRPTFGLCIMFALLIALACLVPGDVFGQSESTEDKPDSASGKFPASRDTNTTNNAKASAEPKFSLHKRSFVLWSVPFEDRDEEGLQVRLSAKYLLLDCALGGGNGLSQKLCLVQSSSKENLFHRFTIAFSYTTDFDFYVSSDADEELRRDSRPVRNRKTSPALHFRWNKEEPTRETGFDLSDLSISIVHHSNGQDLESNSVFPAGSSDEEIRQAVNELKASNPSWMDGVSRGWNFFEVQAGTKIGNSFSRCEYTFSCWNISGGIKIPFTDHPNPIWWEPGNDSQYTDYNRGTLQLINQWGGDLSKRLELEISCGEEGCSANASARADVRIGKGSFILPIVIYGHRGKNEHLYNYHETADMIGIGLEFSPNRL